MSAVAHTDKQWFGHPRGLSTLFFTEMWERLSYYGMRGILLLFMVAAVEEGGYGMNEAKAGAIYGLYTAGVYLMALPGGWIADRLVGQRRAVLLGGILIAAGHFSMALPTVPSFYAGLVLIVLGTGLLKPNVSAIVGDLYPEGGVRRDAGFSIYYMGINLGAFLGPIVCGYLGENVNWHLGFSAAGVGMVLGLIQYVHGGKFLGEAGTFRGEVTKKTAEAKRSLVAGVAVIAVVVLAVFGLDAAGVVDVTLEKVAQGTGVFIVDLAIVYFAAVLLFGGLTTDQKKKVAVIFFLFLGAALFWAGFEQAGSSMNLFADRDTQRVFFGWEMPASWLQSVNPIFIILLAPVFGALWIRLQRSPPSIPAKFAYGLSLLGIGFFVLAWGASYTGGGTTKVSAAWLVVTYFLHTSGELCLSPVGLSSVTKLAPRHLVGQMMGIWFMGSALGNLIAGMAAGVLENSAPVDLYRWVAIGGIAAGALFFLLTPFLKAMIGVLPGETSAGGAAGGAEPEAA